MTDQFDVFLCHNSEDKSAVKKIGLQLKEKDLHPWLDEWELRPGIPWQRLLEQHINEINAAVVFLGPSGIGPWQQMELEAYLREFVKRNCPVIPIILPGVSKLPELPIFLRGITWVDFRQDEPDPLERLIWGITGERSRSRVTPTQSYTTKGIGNTTNNNIHVTPPQQQSRQIDEPKKISSNGIEWIIAVAVIIVLFYIIAWIAN